MTDPLNEAEAVVDRARAQLADCPCGCNRDATAHLFETLPDEELLYDVADLFKAFADTTRIKILFALMERRHPKCRLPSAAHAQAGTPRAPPTRRQKRHLLAVRRPCVHHAGPGHDPRLRVAWLKSVSSSATKP